MKKYISNIALMSLLLTTSSLAFSENPPKKRRVTKIEASETASQRKMATTIGGMIGAGTLGFVVYNVYKIMRGPVNAAMNGLHTWLTTAKKPVESGTSHRSKKAADKDPGTAPTDRTDGFADIDDVVAPTIATLCGENLVLTLYQPKALKKDSTCRGKSGARRLGFAEGIFRQNQAPFNLMGNHLVLASWKPEMKQQPTPKISHKKRKSRDSTVSIKSSSKRRQVEADVLSPEQQLEQFANKIKKVDDAVEDVLQNQMLNSVRFFATSIQEYLEGFNLIFHLRGNDIDGGERAYLVTASRRIVDIMNQMGELFRSHLTHNSHDQLIVVLANYGFRYSLNTRIWTAPEYVLEFDKDDSSAEDSDDQISIEEQNPISDHSPAENVEPEKTEQQLLEDELNAMAKAFEAEMAELKKELNDEATPIEVATQPAQGQAPSKEEIDKIVNGVDDLIVDEKGEELRDNLRILQQINEPGDEVTVAIQNIIAYNVQYLIDNNKNDELRNTFQILQTSGRAQEYAVMMAIHKIKKHLNIS